jgi:hypothetical protein
MSGCDGGEGRAVPRRTPAAAEVVAVAVESVESARHPQVTEVAGSSGSVPPLRVGAAAGVCRSAAPVVGEAAGGAPVGRVVAHPCLANQEARGVAAGSRARFCLMTRPRDAGP